MPTEKLSVSFEADLASTVRQAAAAEGVSLSSWLADAASARARQRNLRVALDDYAAEHGALSEAELDRLIAEARAGTVVTGPAER